MKTPQKHADLIKAWADGAKIEKQDSTGEWFIDYKPDWYEYSNYRLFQETNPDIEVFANANAYEWISFCDKSAANLKFTFDGETGALKAAEVIA
jgi:hypothetical protein